MTDIVERLRGKPVRHDYFPEADRQEAADEIERLQAENADLVLRAQALDVHARKLEAEIKRLHEELRAVLGHVVELRAEVERLRLLKGTARWKDS
jgi:predicted nuclease with TOPRIM domain